MPDRDAANLLFIGELRWLEASTCCSRLCPGDAPAGPRPPSSAPARTNVVAAAGAARGIDHLVHLHGPLRAPGPAARPASRSPVARQILSLCHARGHGRGASDHRQPHRHSPSSLRQTAWCRRGMRRRCSPPSRPCLRYPAAAEAKAREGARAVAGGFDARRMAEAVTGSMPRRWRTAAPRPDLFRNETSARAARVLSLSRTLSAGDSADAASSSPHHRQPTATSAGHGAQATTGQAAACRIPPSAEPVRHHAERDHRCAAALGESLVILALGPRF